MPRVDDGLDESLHRRKAQPVAIQVVQKQLAALTEKVAALEERVEKLARCAKGSGFEFAPDVHSDDEIPF